jgi:hypothetical protein
MDDRADVRLAASHGTAARRLVGAVESVRAGRREAPQCSTVSQKALT